MEEDQGLVNCSRYQTVLAAVAGNATPAEGKLMTVGTSCNPGCMAIFGTVPVGEGCLLASAGIEVKSLGSLIERLLLGTHSLAELRASSGSSQPALFFSAGTTP